MDIAISQNKVPVRLTIERWIHIVEHHDDLAGYYDEVLNVVENPDLVISGYQNALIALREIKAGKYLAIVYKEIKKTDGFIITGYFTAKMNLKKQIIVWKK
ncbi:MAG: hypothetical protein HY840_13935 [Bacteroidetes bacterium]|nr:hypothetical protein [Bacteroidota bacterium]